MTPACPARTAGTLLAALFTAVVTHAQEVHKCTVNGSVTYQAKPCPTGDVVLPSAPMPSEQDQRQAAADLQRQRVQAATGAILDRQVVPLPQSAPQSSTGQTIIVVVPGGASKRAYVLRPNTRTPAAPPPPLTNCERLNRDFAGAVDKRDQLKAPSELASHAQLLQAAEDDVGRIRELAQASHCNLR